MRRQTQNMVLFLVGVAILMITMTGVYTRYVKPSMWPWLAAAAVVIIFLAVSAILDEIRDGLRRADQDQDGHRHRSGIVWLLTIPIIVLIFVVPPALRPRAVAPSVTTVSAAALRHPFGPLPAGRAPTVPLTEVLMRIATDSSDTLTGRLITITGFTMKDADHTDLARIVITCCAADAQLARLRITGSGAATVAAYADNTWVSVEGTIPGGQHYTATHWVPIVQVSAVTRIDPPASPYGA